MSGTYGRLKMASVTIVTLLRGMGPAIEKWMNEPLEWNTQPLRGTEPKKLIQVQEPAHAPVSPAPAAPSTSVPGPNPRAAM